MGQLWATLPTKHPGDIGPTAATATATATAATKHGSHNHNG